MRTRATFASVLFGLVLALGAVPASAALVNGDLTFSGNFETAGPLGSASTLMMPGNDFDVDGSNGDFSSILQGDIGSITDIDLAGSFMANIAGFTLNVGNLVVLAQDDNFLLLQGTGTVSGNGFDTTAITFNLSANVNGPIKNWSAGATTVVPVPGALVLFGSALLGVLGLRRR